MAKLNDLTSNKVQERKRQVRTYGTKTDLASTVVERGSTHWAEGSNVNIDGSLGVAGTATVSGTLSVTGTLNASGSINLSGSTGITGPLNVTGTTTIGGNTSITGELVVTGPTTLDGILDIGGDTTITGLLAVEGNSTISGTLDITGRTTIAADLELLTGGKLIAGETTIEPTGRATFGDVIIDPNSIYMIQAPGGNMVSGAADQISLSSSTSSSVSLDSTRAELDYKGAAKTTLDGLKAQLSFGTSLVKARAGAIDLDTAKVNVSGQLDVTGFTWLRGAGLYFPGIPTTAYPPNLHITSTGQVFRSTWTPA